MPDGNVPSPTITLQYAQWAAVQNLYRYLEEGEKRIALVGPTGWGKSLVATTILHLALRNLFEAAVVVVPRVAIEGNFETVDSFIEIEPEIVSGSASYIPPFNPKDMWFRARDASQTNASLFRQHVGPGRPRNPVFIATHQGIVAWKKVVEEMEGLEGRILVVDEAHHMHEGREGTVLSQVVDTWLEKGGTILGMTATPFRNDGREVFLGFKTHRYSMAEHSAAGNAPDNFQVRLKKLDFIATTRQEFEGESVSKEALANGFGHVQVREDWEEEGGPKAVVCVPAGRSVAWSAALLEELALVCPRERIFNAVGSGKEVQDALNDLLDSERRCVRFEDSKVDIILVCGRLVEGADWVFASHFYNIGMSRSYQQIVQKWGRAARFKGRIAGYPERHKDTCALTMFVPVLGGKLLASHKRSHHKKSLVLTAGLADMAVGNAYWTMLIMGEKFDRIPRANRDDVIEGQRKKQQVYVRPDRRAQMRAAMIALAGERGTLGVQELLEFAEKSGTFEARVVVLDELSQDPDIAAAARQALLNEDNFEIGLRKALSGVEEIFKDRTVPIGGAKEIVGFLTEVTGEDSMEVSRRLRRGAGGVVEVTEEKKTLTLEDCESIDFHTVLHEWYTSAPPYTRFDASVDLQTLVKAYRSKLDFDLTLYEVIMGDEDEVLSQWVHLLDSPPMGRFDTNATQVDCALRGYHQLTDRVCVLEVDWGDDVRHVVRKRIRLESLAKNIKVQWPHVGCLSELVGCSVKLGQYVGGNIIDVGKKRNLCTSRRKLFRRFIQALRKINIVLKAKKGLYVIEASVPSFADMVCSRVRELSGKSVDSGLISVRTKQGLDNARRQGKTLGRPPVPRPDAAEVQALREGGASWGRVAEVLGCSVWAARKAGA